MKPPVTPRYEGRKHTYFLWVVWNMCSPVSTAVLEPFKRKVTRFLIVKKQTNPKTLALKFQPKQFKLDNI